VLDFSRGALCVRGFQIGKQPIPAGEILLFPL
jgi:hypothetical protein